MAAQGSQLTNKYAEGYPGKRYYGGCEYVDVVEQLAIDRVKQLFGAEAANVQPNSPQAKGVFFAMLAGRHDHGHEPAHGGHLTHGSPVNMSGKWFNVVSYGLNENEDIDYEAAEKLAQEHKPKLIVAGASAFSLKIDFERLAKIAKSVGAYLMVDMAHYAGLIAAGVYESGAARGLRDDDDAQEPARPARRRDPDEGRVREADQLGDLPGIQGGPLMHVIAGKAVAFKEALSPEFKAYQEKVVENARVLAETLVKRGLRIVSGRTESHVMLVDLRAKNITGKAAEAAGRGAHHGEQERDSERPGKAVRDERRAPGFAGDDDAWLRSGGSGAGGQPDRGRAGQSGRCSDDRARARAGRRADQAFPGLSLIDDALPVLPA